jgi:hypothetical protein
MPAEVVDFARAYVLPPGLAVADPEDIAIPQYIGSVEETVETPRASRELLQQTTRAAAARTSGADEIRSFRWLRRTGLPR